MSVSIKDIAKLAGVSHSTVSRALRNSPLIPAHTRERIQLLAHEHGYSASAIARSLVLRKTYTIGVVVTSIADPFNGEIVGGIEEVANNSGYSVVLATSQADPKREMEVVRSFRERRVDGILVASSRVGSVHVPSLSNLQIPIVLLNNQHPSKFVYSVAIDDLDGGQRATAHLIEIGHSRIAYIGDELGLESDRRRHAGYLRALTAAKLPVRNEYSVRGNGKPEGAHHAVDHLLSLPEPPTAIFCYNDMTALGVLESLTNRGMTVPRDLSLVGFDDLFFTPFLRPPLTTFRQPQRELGEGAMRLLLAVLDDAQTERTVCVQGQMVVRGSTAPPLTS